MRFFRCRPVFFSFLRLLFCSWYHRVLWHACVSKQKITSLPQNIGFIWPIISASFKKVLWKCQGEEVKIYSSSRSHIIYIFFYLIFIHWLFFQYFLFPIIGIFRVKFVESLFYIIFSANILKRMFERWVNQRAYLNDYQMSSKNAQSVLNTKF